jgi:hypothetical protein
MTIQNSKLLEKGSCIVYHFNHEGRDYYTPRHKKSFEFAPTMSG